MQLDQKIITNLRTLSIDAVQKANSGHPGFPLGAAPLIYTIWKDFLSYNPKNPSWHNRDRFILSAGHGSALYYAMLHLSGYDLSLDDLKNFRQYKSKTPGHPEYGHTSGIDATTGPLGHGFATGVGMAIAEKMLAARYNKPSFPVIDHYVYGIVSDGDMMEGVSSEAASLAATLGLGKIIYLYDDNKITIEGNTDIAFTENVKMRFDAYGWHTLTVDNAEDVGAISDAIEKAKIVQDKPSLIIVHTHIGYKSPKQDTAAAHGEPLGEEGVRKTKDALGVAADAAFIVSEDVRKFFADKEKVLAEKENTWNELFARYKKEYAELGSELEKRLKGDIAIADDYGQQLFAETKATSTREASGVIIQELARLVPALCGGSADLAPSNKTYINNAGDFSKETPDGRNIHFGVREQAMTAVTNGMALHGGFIPYCATFLVFADFMRPAIRLAALMGVHAVFVLTHDSVAVGEDGPTHQPVEQTMSLRIIPNMTVYRPADALETVECWRMAVNDKKPCALLLTRQKLPVLHDYKDALANTQKGGYIISPEKSGELDITIIATGSEVSLCLNAQKTLLEKGINSRIVSLPSWEVFDRQDESYIGSVIASDKPVMAVEAGVSAPWAKYTKNADNVIGIDSFGISGPGSEVYEKFGFNIENIVSKVKQITGK